MKPKNATIVLLVFLILGMFASSKLVQAQSGGGTGIPEGPANANLVWKEINPKDGAQYPKNITYNLSFWTSCINMETQTDLQFTFDVKFEKWEPGENGAPGTWEEQPWSTGTTDPLVPPGSYEWGLFKYTVTGPKDPGNYRMTITPHCSGIKDKNGPDEMILKKDFQSKTWSWKVKD